MKRVAENVILVAIVSVDHFDLINTFVLNPKSETPFPMKIAILSDIHDNVWTLRATIQAIQNTDLLICCGDLCSPFVVPIMGENYSKPIHLVFGNNDGDLFRITKNANRYAHFHIEGEYFQGILDGKRFALNHYDHIASDLARSGNFDLVCFGHNHRFEIKRFGKSLAINPGTLLGYSPLDSCDVPPTFAIYDSETDEAIGYQLITPKISHTSVTILPYPQKGGNRIQDA